MCLTHWEQYNNPGYRTVCRGGHHLAHGFGPDITGGEDTWDACFSGFISHNVTLAVHWQLVDKNTGTGSGADKDEGPGSGKITGYSGLPVFNGYTLQGVFGTIDPAYLAIPEHIDFLVILDSAKWPQNGQTDE